MITDPQRVNKTSKYRSQQRTKPSRCGVQFSFQPSFFLPPSPPSLGSASTLDTCTTICYTYTAIHLVSPAHPKSTQSDTYNKLPSPCRTASLMTLESVTVAADPTVTSRPSKGRRLLWPKKHPLQRYSWNVASIISLQLIMIPRR